MKIPVNEPKIAPNALKYVSNCITTGWISSAGPYIQKFEEKFAKYLNVKYAITTSSGTAALHLALAALKIKKGDEVIIPAHTIAACAFAVVYTGAKPVLVDIQPDTWNIDVTQLESKINSHTKAIMPVHIYGHPVDMKQVMRVARKYNLNVIEDAAEAHGAEYKDKKVGSIGDIGCFSFYANKIVTTGEGGMIVTNNKNLAVRAKRLKDLAHNPNKRFLHDEVGFNYRMTNLQAALGLAQLENIKKYIKHKIWMAGLYNKLLKNVEGITLPVEKNWAKNVYWMYSIIINDNFGINRDQLQMELKKEGIDTRTFFISLHRQPALRKLGYLFGERYPITDYVSKRGLYLPSGLAITKEQIDFVCSMIKKIKKRI
jgi:perosamine synthetase